MKFLLFSALAMAYAQPAIVVYPSGSNVFAVLLVPSGLPPRTMVLPSVTVGRTRTFLDPIEVSQQGAAYRIGTAAIEATFGAYFTLPEKTFRIQTKHFLEGFTFEGNELTIHGMFKPEPAFVYFDVSLSPVRLTAANGKLIIVVHPSNMPTIVTVCQAGICDSLLVRLRPRV